MTPLDPYDDGTRALRALRVDLVAATPEEIMECLLRVDRGKAAAVAVGLVRHLGLELVGRASVAMDDAREEPLRAAVRVAGGIAGALLDK